MPGLRSSSAPALRPIPVQGLHTEKTHANKPLKHLAQNPSSFPLKHSKAMDTRDTFVLIHDELAGDPHYTLSLCVVPCPHHTPCCRPPEVVQTFHSGTETAMDESSFAFPTTAQSASVVLLGCLHQGMVN